MKLTIIILLTFGIVKSKVLQSLCLVIIAIFLKWLLFPFSIIWTVLSVYGSLSFKMANALMAKWLKEIAISQDQLGNVMLGMPLTDLLLREPTYYQFGHSDDTISEVLGRNKYADNLNWLGKAIAGILNFIDKNHVEKAVND